MASRTQHLGFMLFMGFMLPLGFILFMSFMLVTMESTDRSHLPCSEPLTDVLSAFADTDAHRNSVKGLFLPSTTCYLNQWSPHLHPTHLIKLDAWERASIPLCPHPFPHPTSISHEVLSILPSKFSLSVNSIISFPSAVALIQSSVHSCLQLSF